MLYPLSKLKQSLFSGLSARALLIACSGFFLAGCDDAKAPLSIDEVATQGAYSIRFSHSGELAMVGSLHHGGSLWSLSPKERHFDWNHSSGKVSQITNSAFSPDDEFIATTDNRTIVLWSGVSGEAIWFWNAPGDIEDIALTQQGNLALLAMQDYTATLFDIKNGGIRQRLAHDGIVYDVSISADGLIAASASGDKTVKVWNLQNGELIRSFEHDNQVRTAQLSADGRYLFSSALGEAGKIWDLSSGKLMQSLAGVRGHYTTAQFRQNQLLTGNSSGKVELWSLNDGKRLNAWRASPSDSWVSNNVQVEDVRFRDQQIWAAASNGRLYRMR